MTDDTNAQKIAALLDNDGQTWETEDGQTLEEIAIKLGGITETDGEFWRIEFEDGSALTGTAGGWDIEGDEPFRMAGA